MDAAYLKETVGDALASGLAAVASNQPTDAVEYLGHYLLKHYESAQRESANRDKRSEMELKAQYARELALKAKAESSKSTGGASPDSDAALKSKLSGINVESFDSIISEVLDRLKTVAGASSAYIGVKESVKDEASESSTERIKYVATSTGSEAIKQEVLRQGAGISWDALKEPEAAPEGDEPPADGSVPEKKERQPVYIDNVLADARTQFFGIPRLGSYLAVPFKYNTFVYEGSPAAYAAAVEALSGDVEEEAPVDEEPTDPDAPPKPVKTPETPEQRRYRKLNEAMGKATDFLLCLDTLGDDKAITPEGQAYAASWKEAIADALQKYEISKIEREARLLDEFAKWNAAAAEESAGKDADLEANIDTAVTALGAEALPTDVDHVKANLTLSHTKAVVTNAAEAYSSLASLHFPPPATTLNALKLVLLALRYSSSEINESSSANGVSWAKVKGILATSFLDRVSAYNTAPSSSEAKHAPTAWPASVHSAIRELKSDALAGESMAVKYVVQWFQAVLTLRDAVAAKTAADEAVAKAAAEAEAAASAAPVDEPVDA